jgi:hypothetical protein
MKMNTALQVIIALFLTVLLFIANLVVSFDKETEKRKTGDAVREDCLGGHPGNTAAKPASPSVSPEPQQLPAYIPPESWKRYKIADAFTLSVPPTVELRKNYDKYSQRIKDINFHGYKVNINNIVFQQKGLGKTSPEAYKTYCRILVDLTEGNTGDFMESTTYQELHADDIRDFREAAVQNSGEYELIGKAKVRWIRIEDTYGIEVEYVRKGTENKHARVCIYYFFNDDKLATIILSYRLEDAHRWEKDFSQIIRTFSWNK